jgi:hypothetical protein
MRGSEPGQPAWPLGLAVLVLRHVEKSQLAPL